jgi:hypothetical protein
LKVSQKLRRCHDGNAEALWPGSKPGRFNTSSYSRSSAVETATLKSPSATLGEELAAERSAEDGKRSPVEVY